MSFQVGNLHPRDMEKYNDGKKYMLMVQTTDGSYHSLIPLLRSEGSVRFRTIREAQQWVRDWGHLIGANLIYDACPGEIKRN